VTPDGSATLAVPPGWTAAVEDAEEEAVEDAVDEGVLDEPLLPLLHAATAHASRAAVPTATVRASRDRRLFRNINCAPWL